MNETDVDNSYDMFLDVFTKMNDKHCPLKKIYQRKQRRKTLVYKWFKKCL